MPGGTFQIPTAYAAAAAVVSDGVIALANPNLLSSASAAFTVLDRYKRIVVAGAGAAAADLTTRIKNVLSATQVELVDPASTAVLSADLTYVVGVYKLRNLLSKGDIDSRVYDILSAHRLQLQVNSLSPGKIYVGGEFLTPTNAGIELATPFAVDDRAAGATLDDFVCADADASLLNILWADS